MLFYSSGYTAGNWAQSCLRVGGGSGGCVGQVEPPEWEEAGGFALCFLLAEGCFWDTGSQGHWAENAEKGLRVDRVRQEVWARPRNLRTKCGDYCLQVLTQQIRGPSRALTL